MKIVEWLLQRLEVLSEPIAVVTYSPGDGEIGAEIQEAPLFDRPLAV